MGEGRDRKGPDSCERAVKKKKNKKKKTTSFNSI